MKLKKNDLVIHQSGEIVTVLKVYEKLETQEEFVQVFNDKKVFYDRIESFKPMDCLLLRCNSCNVEKYEVEIAVNVDNGMYVCQCGSSTFTPLNMEEISLI